MHSLLVRIATEIRGQRVTQQEAMYTKPKCRQDCQSKENNPLRSLSSIFSYFNLKHDLS